MILFYKVKVLSVNSYQYGERLGKQRKVETSIQADKKPTAAN